MKLTKRGGTSILYLKKSGDIEDLLLHMGASETSMMLMGSKMFKDVRNTVNRKVNCDTANVTKTVEADAEQMDVIRRIREQGIMERLPDKLLIDADAAIVDFLVLAVFIPDALRDGVFTEPVLNR